MTAWELSKNVFLLLSYRLLWFVIRRWTPAWELCSGVFHTDSPIGNMAVNIRIQKKNHTNIKTMLQKPCQALWKGGGVFLCCCGRAKKYKKRESWHLKLIYVNVKLFVWLNYFTDLNVSVFLCNTLKVEQVKLFSAWYSARVLWLCMLYLSTELSFFTLTLPPTNCPVLLVKTFQGCWNLTYLFNFEHLLHLFFFWWGGGTPKVMFCTGNQAFGKKTMFIWNVSVLRLKTLPFGY